MKYHLLAAGIFLAAKCAAQCAGTITDAFSKEKIPGAVVAVDNSFLVTTSDAEGRFFFPKLKEKSVRLHISHIGFVTQTTEVLLPDEQLQISLLPETYMTGEVIVTATRASDKSPTAFSTVSKESLEKINLGQDLPYLLSHTPSVVVTSDAGAGVGYTGIRIRGSDPTRVNVTINGVPVNDAEGNMVYWVDLPDFVSSVENIQVQRGIGTSTNGAGAFGASINLLSSSPAAAPYATINESYGSFNTWKHTMNFGTGLLKNKFAFEGRMSKINSDGFVDRASADLKSFYLAGGYFGKKHTLRSIIFSGKEKTYQAWNGVPQAKLRDDRNGLVTHYYNNTGYLYHTREDSANLFSSGNRTYNVFTYENQTDNYQQDYYQLHYSFAATSALLLNVALHYTKGKGYYEEYKYNQSFSDYNLDDVTIGMDTISNTNLIRQKWLDNDFYGFTLSSNYETDKMQFTVGAAGNRYTGRHFDQIIWAEYSGNSGKDFVYDDNDATKNDFNAFVKLIYSLSTKLHLFADVQYRLVDYFFLGFDEAIQSTRQHAKHHFLNPKAGVTFELNRKNRVYASAAIGNKEPIRKDYVESSARSRPQPEQMTDVEAGYKYSSDRLRLGANFYFMNYKDQLILTGRVNDVGEYTRMNVEQSSRTGLELEADWSIVKSLSVSGNLTLSENKIKSFSEYVDDYDAGGQRVKTTSNSDIAFSPPVILSATISWIPFKNLSLDFISKYVGRQYLDNTSDETRKLDAYFLNDVLLQYRLFPSFCKEIALKLAVYNLLDHEYESNGYTYGYYSGGALIQENFYYPQAGMNWLGGITIGF